MRIEFYGDRVSGWQVDSRLPEMGMGMGKNIFALKVFLPAQLKSGLQQHADKAQAPLGKFARAMICAHLFGRDVGPKFLMTTDESGR